MATKTRTLKDIETDENELAQTTEALESQHDSLQSAIADRVLSGEPVGELEEQQGGIMARLNAIPVLRQRLEAERHAAEVKKAEAEFRKHCRAIAARMAERDALRDEADQLLAASKAKAAEARRVGEGITLLNGRKSNGRKRLKALGLNDIDIQAIRREYYE